MTSPSSLTPVMERLIEWMRSRPDRSVHRHPGGYWWEQDPRSTYLSGFGTTTVAALVSRGVAEWVEWQDGRSGRFPIQARLIEAASSEDGTPADLTIRARIPRRCTQPQALARIMTREFDTEPLRAKGYKWFRVTAPADDPTHAYMECWREKPAKEGRLNRSAAT